MNKMTYKKQVGLLLKVLPEVSKEAGLALHGGTAINLFYRNMPRLSVDIDLTWLSDEGRETAFPRINQALSAIKDRLEKYSSPINITHDKENLKLIISKDGASIKTEVNPIKRGSYAEAIEFDLCENAQQEFNAFCIISVVEKGMLFGGKICAALDRQHPRDLFDVKWLLDENGWDDAIKKGFIFYLISGNRPLYELLFPHFTDQISAFETQFKGMTNHPFSYEDFENTREQLVEVIHKELTEDDKEFLIGLENGTPDWEIYDFKDFPAVKWKLRNIEKFKKDKPEEHRELMEKLKNGLNSL
jgi:predicted nucleotidyltransferase component of viral defense system